MTHDLRRKTFRPISIHPVLLNSPSTAKRVAKKHFTSIMFFGPTQHKPMSSRSPVVQSSLMLSEDTIARFLCMDRRGGLSPTCVNFRYKMFCATVGKHTLYGASTPMTMESYCDRSTHYSRCWRMRSTSEASRSKCLV